MDRAEPVKKSRGRPSSFVREDMVDTIMNLFWEHGYAGLSFNEIAKATGLTRASLYNAFESKEALLLEVLDHYFADAPDAVLNTVRPGDPVGPALQKMLIMASELRGADDKHRGCFAVNCVTELMGGASPLSQAIQEAYEGRRKLLIALMQQAIEQQELPAGTDPAISGNLMLAFMSGLNTFSKNGSSAARLKKMSNAFLQQLGFAIC